MLYLSFVDKCQRNPCLDRFRGYFLQYQLLSFLPCGRDSFSIAVAMPLTVTFHRWPMPTQPLSGSLPRTFSLIQASGFSETAATTHAVSFFSISPANADENRVRTVSEDVPSLCFLFCEKDSLVLAVVTSHVSLSFAGQCRRG